MLPWALGDALLAGDVLELGSGSGAMAAATAIRFPDARVTATDIDPAMVSAAEKRLAGLPNATARRPGSPQRLVSAAELGDELRRLGFDARVESFGRGQVMRFTARKR